MNFGVNLLGRVTQFALQLIMLRLVTTLLDKTEAALLFVTLLIAGAASLLLISPIGQYFNRHLLEFENQRRVSLQLFSFIGYAACVSPFVIAISILYFGMQEETFVDWKVHAVSACYFFATTLNQVCTSGLNVLGRSREFVIYSVMTQLLILALISGLNLIGASHLGWLICLVVANIIVGCCACYSLLDGSHSALYSANQRAHWFAGIPLEAEKAWKFGRHVLIALLCVWTYQVGFRFELLPLIGAKEFALFSMGYSLAAVLFSGSEQILNSFCLPIYYKKAGSESPRLAWEWLARICLPTYLVALIVAFSLSDVLVVVFFDKSYLDASFYVRVGAMFEFLRVVHSLFAAHSHGLKKTDLLTKPAICGALVFLGGHLSLYNSPSATGLFVLVFCSACIATGYLIYTYAHSSQKVSLDTSTIYKLVPFGILTLILSEMIPNELTVLAAFGYLSVAAVISFVFWVYVVWDIVTEIVTLEAARRR